MPATDRLDRAVRAMRGHGVDALLVGAGADLRYLSGYHALPLERLTLLVARSDGSHALVVPELERARAQASPLPPDVDLVTYGETDDPYRLVADRLGGLPAVARLGVGDTLWAAFLLPLQSRLPRAAWVTASTVTRELRMRKDAAELDALRRAARAIDRVHARMPDMLRPDRTEAQVGREVADAILAEGHDDVRFVIVGSGPNSASPHHETGERTLRAGDVVVVDIGGSLDGYCSDCTRTYVVGRPPEGFAEAHAALEAAHRAACDATRPGVSAAAVDAAARSVLAEDGYGPHFIHRTGHGIGLDEHEHPYVVEGNDQLLEPGMTFSIEPGIYLPGRFGMRVEDIVAVTADGCERLNTLDRAAVTVDGRP